MKNKKTLLMIPLVVVIACLFWFVFNNDFSKFISNKSDESLKILKWNNFYNGDNVQMYYMNHNNENIRKFGNSHNLEELIASDTTSIEKCKTFFKWMDGNIQYKKNAIYLSKDAYEIEFKKDEKIIMNNDEIAEFFNEGMAYFKVYSRTGVLVGDINSEMNEYIYRINEFWSSEHEKWIAVDSSEGVMFFKDGIPLSGSELIISNNGEVEFVSINDKKINEQYKSFLGKFNYAYSIKIDNNKYGEGVINSLVTYTKKTPFLMIKNVFYTPSIFVNKASLFDKSPHIKYVNELSDKEAIMIFGRKKTVNTDENQTYLAVGVMSNSEMLQEYYYSTNGSDWLNVDGEYHFFCALKNGENKVKISLDGKEILKEVVFEYENNEIKK
ncbi:hypothetical protein [Oceanirhabdus sp. W0125-5]|uniref:hypothetical protein n=1 Tax=Oceanirhabdus sp. W0125-5 TaxID=2999116 RepID=UPI0022F327A5|nr:hypothetical protein [Oceanirhabdus sp. W0125-5]WBW98699.1 hypothetical protein OW730_08050 [Oceanirhabdus sp. W0125-5]